MTEKEYYSLIGEKISSLRSSMGINQDELAQFLNVSRPSIGNIEKGRQRPSMFLMQQMADYFSVDLNKILPDIPKQVNRVRTVGADKALRESKSVNDLFNFVLSQTTY